MPGWDGFDVVRYVQRSLPVPVLVDNDEKQYGPGRADSALAGAQQLLFSSR
jgi:glucokinase